MANPYHGPDGKFTSRGEAGKAYTDAILAAQQEGDYEKALRLGKERSEMFKDGKEWEEEEARRLFDPNSILPNNDNDPIFYRNDKLDAYLNSSGDKSARINDFNRYAKLILAEKANDDLNFGLNEKGQLTVPLGFHGQYTRTVTERATKLAQQRQNIIRKYGEAAKSGNMHFLGTSDNYNFDLPARATIPQEGDVVAKKAGNSVSEPFYIRTVLPDGNAVMVGEVGIYEVNIAGLTEGEWYYGEEKSMTPPARGGA